MNLQTGRPTVDGSPDIALHLNPRLASHTVLNSRKGNEWGVEEKQPLSVVLEEDGGGAAFKVFQPGQQVLIVIKAETKYYQVQTLKTRVVLLN